MDPLADLVASGGEVAGLLKQRTTNKTWVLLVQTAGVPVPKPLHVFVAVGNVLMCSLKPAMEQVGSEGRRRWDLAAGGDFPPLVPPCRIPP